MKVSILISMLVCIAVAMTLALSFASVTLASGSVQPLAREAHLKLFQEWKGTHKRQYESESEEALRFTVWRSNFEMIRNHNADPTRTFDMAVNQFADMTQQEFKDKVLRGSGATGVMERKAGKKPGIDGAKVLNVDAPLPEVVDWTAKGKVTPPGNQGQCGSCWAFSVVGAVESLFAIEHNDLQLLSVQQVMDCDTNNYGCNGGFPDYAYDYIAKNGLERQQDYPYISENGQDGTCHYNEDAAKYLITSHVDIPKNSTQHLLAAVAQQPVNVAMDGTQMMFYSSGVLKCNKQNPEIDHTLLVTGYDQKNKYYRCKNSWGWWGDQGYVNIYLGDYIESCGITDQANYPTGSKYRDN